jgi:hypothetical protein
MIVRSVLDNVVRVAGFVVAVALAAVTAAYEAVYAELYFSPTVRAPYALIAALVLNPALVWFAYTVTGRRAAALGPTLAWVCVMFAASSATSEGDLILTNDNWVGIATLIGGTVAFAVGGYRLILVGTRPAPTRAESAEPAEQAESMRP